jgi:hypothetical protein
METTSNTAKMIYAKAFTAKMILAKMVKHKPEGNWTMVEVPGGFQVRRVEVIAPKVVKPVAKATTAPAVKAKKGDMTVTLTAAYKGQSVRWVDFAAPIGVSNVKFVNKARILGSDLVDGVFTFTVSRAFAVEKGMLTLDQIEVAA